jgi:hypothetical protein
LAACWKDCTPAQARLGRATYKALRQRLPGATAFLYDNPRGLVVGFGPSDRPSEAILSLVLYGGRVTLCFLQGVHLPDPDKMLRGGGNQVRNVRLDDPATAWGTPAVQRLLRIAVERSPVPMPARGGRLVVRVAGPGRRA